ncbi:MAG: hypothetical protein FJ102_23975 [Deltaproteobacteria bacterium]|nr:hypothetical protein [Deltaproteobacteria bacterium]
MFALSLAPLLGCHVLEEYSVECTSDMPCAKAGDTDPDADTDTDTDSDTDTDTDTGPPPEPSVGWVVSLVGGTTGRVRVYDPSTREVTYEWAGFGTYGGTAYYNPSTGAGVLFSDDEIVFLGADGTTSTYGGGLSGSRYDVSRLGRYGILALQGGVIRFDESFSVLELMIVYGTFGNTLPVGGNANVGYLADVASGGPDLYTLQPSGSYELTYTDYDSSTQRGANVFVGPGDAPFGCSSGGGIYEVDDLMVGSRDPYLSYDGEVTDVSECAYDPQSDQFLLFSPTAGVIRVDPDGTGKQVFSPPNGYTLHNVYFYEI